MKNNDPKEWTDARELAKFAEWLHERTGWTDLEVAFIPHIRAQADIAMRAFKGGKTVVVERQPVQLTNAFYDAEIVVLP